MSYKKYKRHLSRYVKENMRRGYSLKAIEKSLLIHGYEPGLVNALINDYKLKSLLARSAVMVSLLAVFSLAIFFIKSNPTGYAVKETAFNFTDGMGLIVNESYEHIWNLENKGQLKSVRISGKAMPSGIVKVYLEHENTTYLIFDNKKLGKGLEEITAFAVKEKNEDEGDDKEKGEDKEKKEKNETEDAEVNETEDDGPTINETLPEEAVLNETIINETPENETQIINQTINATSEINETIVPAINETLPLNETINVTLPVNGATNITPINESANISRSIAIILQYNKNTSYDEDNDGIENVDNVIDLSVGNTEFTWDYKPENICTRWEVYSIEDDKSTTACYGGSKCCNFVGLEPAREQWDEVFYLTYGQYGAASSNIVSAQVIYADYNLSADSSFAEIYYSGWQNLSAYFAQEYEKFENVCIETCILPNLNATSYRLIFKIENSTLILDSISYELLSYEKTNHAPVLLKNFSNISVFNDENYAVNLGEYFHDEDNDTLAYSFYNSSAVDILMANGTAAIIPARNFTGTGYMFFTANDGIETAMSNIFEIKIRQRERALKSLRSMIAG